MMKTTGSNSIDVLLIFKRSRVEESMRTLLGAFERIQHIYQADEEQTVMEIMRVHQPQLVLFDFDLSQPELPSLLMNIKNNWMDTLCISISDSASRLRTAREAGSDVLLLKGFLAGELFDIIEKLFDQPVNSDHLSESP